MTDSAGLSSSALSDRSVLQTAEDWFVLVVTGPDRHAAVLVGFLTEPSRGQLCRPRILLRLAGFRAGRSVNTGITDTGSRS